MSKKLVQNEVREVIDELSGVIFKSHEEYSESSKIFFKERYSTIISFLPQISRADIGLEIGLCGGILAFSIRRLFKLNKLYTLEHPITSKHYTGQFIKKLANENIINVPVDLRAGLLPWKNNYFDFVIFSEVIEHLVPSDIPLVINEIKRVLKRRGWALITTPNIASFSKRINLLRGKNPIEFDLTLHDQATYGHIREYTMEELTSVMGGGKNFKERLFYDRH